MSAVRAPHSRRMRRTTGLALASGRRRYLQKWASARATALDGTGTSQTFTADHANEEIDITAHGHVLGDGPFVVSNAGGDLPAGLVAGQLYWPSIVSVNAMQLHRSGLSAKRGTSVELMSDAGTGTHSLTPAATSAAILEHVRQGVSVGRLNAATDIDSFI